MSTLISPEHQCILDDMLIQRTEFARKMDADEVDTISALIARGVMDSSRLRCTKSAEEIKETVIQQILALVSGLPDDTPMIVSNSDGQRIAARTMRVWALFHCTPEGKQ